MSRRYYHSDLRRHSAREYAATKRTNIIARRRRSRLFLMKGMLARIGTPSGSDRSLAVRCCDPCSRRSPPRCRQRGAEHQPEQNQSDPVRIHRRCGTVGARNMRESLAALLALECLAPDSRSAACPAMCWYSFCSTSSAPQDFGDLAFRRRASTAPSMRAARASPGVALHCAWRFASSLRAPLQLSRRQLILRVVGRRATPPSRWPLPWAIRSLQRAPQALHLGVVRRIALLGLRQFGPHRRDVREIARLGDQIGADLAQLHAEHRFLFLGREYLLLQIIELPLGILDHALIARAEIRAAPRRTCCLSLGELGIDIAHLLPRRFPIAFAEIRPPRPRPRCAALVVGQEQLRQAVVDRSGDRGIWDCCNAMKTRSIPPAA